MAVSQGQDDEVMAAINITPLTDVLLVLLIIFMIAAAAIQKEKIKIPKTHYKAKANEADTIISIDKDGKVFVGANEVDISQLEPYLEKLRKKLPVDEATGELTHKVIIKSDKDALYGVVARVMDASKSAGLNEISLATKPLKENEASPENQEQKNHSLKSQGGRG
jgi:biopolymer transport protein ExbD